MALFKKKEEPSNKIGRVRKCPQCGAAVPSSKVICPECGWEFDDVSDRQSAVEKLSEAIAKSHRLFSSQSEYEVVEAFRIPKAKSDLLELIIFFKSHADFDDLEDSYTIKYDEAMYKAKQYYSKDPDFLRMFEEYAVIEERRKRQKIWQERIEMLKKISIIAGIVIGVSLLGWGIWKLATIPHEKKITIEEAIALNDDDAISKAIKETKKIDNPLSVIKALINSNRLDAAIDFYENRTTHTSTYEMQYRNSGITQEATSLIYSALIQNERMEEAWRYHALEYDDPNYAGNGWSYYQYVSDVVNYYCQKGDKPMARKFVKEHLVWFVNNVDNGRWGKDYPDFSSAKVNQRLTKYIKEY